MTSVDIRVTSGQLEVSKEKNLLVWSLGKYCAQYNFLHCIGITTKSVIVFGLFFFN